MPAQTPMDRFVDEWSGHSAGERASAQPFLMKLCAALGVPEPTAASIQDGSYRFELPIEGGGQGGNKGFIDMYKAGCFVLEAKQGSEQGDAHLGIARRHTVGWQKAMMGAFNQASRYARQLPLRPGIPFILTVDVGYCIELWSDFSEDRRGYGSYSARQTLLMDDLRKPEVQEHLYTIFTDPWSLDPARRAARVTREIAAELATLARDLEGAGHSAEPVSAFLMRCIFTMFAEDTGLLPDKLFTRALQERWVARPQAFPGELERLWAVMDQGGDFHFDRVLRFNGALFKRRHVIPLTADQIRGLVRAASYDWSEVDPTVFGTLVERALDPTERHQLGAHFTPRAWIERLVRPVVLDPLRARWTAVQAAVQADLNDHERAAGRPGAKKSAAAITRAIGRVEAFHAELCQLRVLDPACGSGNFLVVTYDLLKQLESEALRLIDDLHRLEGSGAAGRLQLQGATVNPAQFLGIEKNPRAREIAELVLWLGHLQWYRRTFGGSAPPEPVLQAHGNIRCGDAVLAWDQAEVERDADGRPRTVWDMRSYKTDPVTGEAVPDETRRVHLLRYTGARKADWPAADVVVGNPPFLGNKRMRMALGDGYAESLRAVWPDVPGSADLVMYWWAQAADLLRQGRIQRFGFITTNSITQVFNREVVATALRGDPPLKLIYAMADHPWVAGGAAVRIAMTAAARADDAVRPRQGRVVQEGGLTVDVVEEEVELLHADLRAGADVAGARPLRANQGVCFQGMNLVGKGFRLDADELPLLGLDPAALPAVVHPYSNARDLTQGGPPRWVIDLYGMTAMQAREQHPALYQRLLERVKPERDQNKDAQRKRDWWLFGRSNEKLRQAWAGLDWFIVTPITSKHRFFVRWPAGAIPDCQVHAICVQSPAMLGVLTGRPHEVFSMVAASRMGVGNDIRWRSGPCFDPYPFPDLTPAQAEALGALALQLDAHRKAVSGRVPKAHLTAQYNALARVRAALAGGPPLSPAELAFHQQAQIGILRELHDEIDAKVAEAYGWPVSLTDEELLERLVALNHARATEEAEGRVRYLRPALQDPRTSAAVVPVPLVEGGGAEEVEEVDDPPSGSDAAPGALAWPRDRLAQVLALLEALRSAPAPRRATELARGFVRADPSDVASLLGALALTGAVRPAEAGPDPRWLPGD
jgi:hypothetical protein